MATECGDEDSDRFMGVAPLCRNRLPASMARLRGRRVDVVTHGGWIEAGEPVKVVEVGGNRVVNWPREFRVPFSSPQIA